MSEDTDFDLLDEGMNGVYFVGESDAAPIAEAVVEAALLLARIDLTACNDKDGLLARIAAALRFPPHFGANWDALEDCLRDLSWLPASGYVLLFEHVDALRAGAEADFDMLLDILADISSEAVDRAVPWHAFFVLPDEDFEQPDEDD